MKWPKNVGENVVVNVSVDETNLDEAKADLNAVADSAEKRVMEALQKLDAKITEAKAERNKLETATAAARRKGRGVW